MKSAKLSRIDEILLSNIALIVGETSAAAQVIKELKTRRSQGEQLSVYDTGRTFLLIPDSHLN